MKSPLVMILLVLCATTKIFSQETEKDKLKVQQVVRDLFEGFAANNFQAMQETMTPDVLILEHDVIFNMDSVAAITSRKRSADFKRTNTLTFFQTEISKDMAFVSYYNEAEIISNGTKWYIKWLESAVLTSSKKGWKIKMLHSTRVERKKL